MPESLVYLNGQLVPASGACLPICDAGIVIVHSLLWSKNLRYVVSADPFMRLLVASAFPRKWFVAINAAVELALFYIIFVANNVYDPVTDELLRALHILPM